MAVLSAKSNGAKYVPFWKKCVGAGRANEGLRASWLEHLAFSRQHCGFEYCRFHGLFHDDMFVYREVDGKPAYNWQYVDDLFDRMLDAGVRPFVELSFCPEALASTPANVFWWKGRISPPKDYAKWAGLVEALVRHCIARYGLDEVRQWYFEVWNEPNLNIFWDGSRSQYFELYKVSALAIKAVDGKLRVGGPATSNYVGDERFDGDREDVSKHLTLRTEDLDALSWKGVWIEAFLAYCEAEGLPVDFVSTHPYPTDFALSPEGVHSGRTRGVDATRRDLQWLKDVVSKSAFPSAEIHLTEWNSSPSSRDASHDCLTEAAYIIKVHLDCLGLTDSLSFWTFTDVFEEMGAGDTIFHGGFGLINYQGIAKPSFHAYRMLHALGDEMLYRQDGLAVTRRSSSGKLIALLYNYPHEMKTAVPFGDRAVTDAALAVGSAKSVHLEFKDLPPGCVFEVEILDKKHGNALAAWEAMGSPEPPSREQTRVLREAAMATEKATLTASPEGNAVFSRVLEPWHVVLITQQ